MPEAATPEHRTMVKVSAAGPCVRTERSRAFFTEEAGCNQITQASEDRDPVSNLNVVTF